MNSLPPTSLPPLRQILLWVSLGLLLASLFHGYWLVGCILFVGVIATFVVIQSGRES